MVSWRPAAARAWPHCRVQVVRGWRVRRRCAAGVSGGGARPGADRRTRPEDRCELRENRDCCAGCRWSSRGQASRTPTRWPS